MHHLSKTETIAGWLLQLAVAGILPQTLFLIAFFGSAIVLILRRAQIPVVAHHFEAI